MKAGRWTSARATCPYYKAQTVSEILCNGTQDGMLIHIGFASPDMRKTYSRTYCESRHTSCPIAQALTTNLNEEDSHES